MARKLRPLLFVLQFVLAGLAVAFLVTLIWPSAGLHLRGSAKLPAPAVAASAAAAPSPGMTGPVSYADAVARAAPAVVNIYANKIITERQVQIFRDPVLQRLLGGSIQPLKRREQSLGSGVIFTSDGYILTNNHVISGADDIQVMLHDGRVAHAQLVGTDPDTDLAVLKIDAGTLPTIQVDAKAPRVGDVVLAIGNPFGIGQTVTMGIVSALGRQLSLSPYEDFIQTDAAINSGNSGGALVNSDGQLVGINTAMLEHAAAQGIGFAIPVRTAKRVLEQIVEHGKVVRGWLGVDVSNVVVAADSGLPAAARGAIVLDVYPGGPAARAGLQAGDVLLAIGKHPIIDSTDLRTREAESVPGSKVQVSGLRAGQPFHAEVVLAERPSMRQIANPG